MILIPSKHNQKSLSLPFCVDLNGTSIHLCLTVRNLGVTLYQISLFSSMFPAPVKSAILICIESVMSITTCHKTLSTQYSLLLSCPESITAIFYSPAVVSNSFINFKKFRTTLQGSSVELLSLITCLPSFTLFTGFLFNKELNTNCFSLPINL